MTDKKTDKTEEIRLTVQTVKRFQDITVASIEDLSHQCPESFNLKQAKQIAKQAQRFLGLFLDETI